MNAFVVIYKDEAGKEVLESWATPEQASQRLNELWGTWGRFGPERHAEARAMFANRVRTQGRWS